ncbi:MAG: glycosyltransferase [Planctomycetota bacterium]
MEEGPRPAVSIVIPGRNCAATLAPCLEALTPQIESGAVAEILFVDDGSTDDSASIAGRYPVRVVAGEGKGPGAARNLGWREASSPLIWFLDSDCVAEPDALQLLLPHLQDPQVGGVGGSYGNMRPDSLLATLIQEEIVERHLRMPSRVDFLATFNVVYRRSVLEQVGGFDERYLKGQDAELAWRVLEHGHELGFDVRSRVKHFHPVGLMSYLRTQRQQGFWRGWLLLAHRDRSVKNQYSNTLDHLAPPLGVLLVASLPFVAVAGFWLASPWGLTLWSGWCLAALLLLALQLPLTRRLLRRTRDWRLLSFAPMAAVRAIYRGVGLTHGVLDARLKGASSREPATPDGTIHS